MSELGRAAVAIALVSGLTGCSPTDQNELDDEEFFDEDGGALPDGGFVDGDSGSFPRRDGGFVVPDAGPFNMVLRPKRLDALLVAEEPPPPISGGTLAISADGKTVVAADPDRDRVYVIDPVTGSFQTVELAHGSEPGRVALDGTGHAHVALRNESSLARIDLATAQLVKQTEVCSHPRGLAYDDARDAILVACASGELVAISAAAHAELSRTFIGLDLRDVIVNVHGDRYVSRYRSAELLKLGSDGRPATQSAPLPSQEMRIAPFAFDGGVGSAPIADGKRTMVTMSPTLAWRTIASVDGLPLMLHQQSQDDEIVIQAAGGYGGGSGCDPITHAAVTQYDENGAPHAAQGLTGAGLVVDVAQSPDGRWLAFAQPGAYLRAERGTIAVVKTQGLSVSDTAPAGAAAPEPQFAPAPPVSDAGSVDAGSAFPGGLCQRNIEYGHEIQATAVAYGHDGTLYAFSREPAQLTVYTPLAAGGDFAQLDESKTIQLSNVSVRDTGHELFHADVGTGLACASCHGEALDDGHVWTFAGFGPRRTQNMRGGLLSTLPLHWEGDLPSFQNLVDEVMTRRMGGFQVEEHYAGALANWLDQQPALKLAPSRAPDVQSALARGKALFESAEVGCASCHSGSALTNNLTVDVGTGGLFQVPSLLGLALHGPFMHDGCAATLLDRFDPSCGGGDAHGKTSHLSTAAQLDLVQYLESL